MTLFLILTSIWAVLSLLLLALSWNLIRIGDIKWHRNLMIFLSIAGLIFTIVYLVKQTWYAPLQLPDGYYPWLVIHGISGLIPMIGAFTLIIARLYAKPSHHFNCHHRNYGRVFSCFWVFAHLGGLYNAALLLTR